MALRITRRGLGRSLAAGCGLLALAGSGRSAPAQDLRFFRIGTGTTGGTYFPIGGLIASAVSRPFGAPPCDQGGSCGVEGLIAVAQASLGSVENVNSVAGGSIESGLSQADIAFWAYTGTGLYADLGPQENLRAIAHLYNELVHVVVAADSGIRDVEDLRGKRLALGDEGSGTLIDARAILGAYGISEADIEPAYMGAERASDAMLAGELDGYMFVGGVPLLAVEDLARRMELRLLPFADQTAWRLRLELPFFTAAMFPEGAYEGVPPVPTIAVGATWITSVDVDEELIYGITQALWHPTTHTLLQNGHARGRDILVENALRGIAIPLHDGAARYYREIGMLEGGEISDPEE
ncbi:MAG: TAXI family TRAP transporter solute-binding subunit [Rhodospirillaceae bacterium]|nr:TAXI family TRAP transporter solute-binding subunit [Rhodospirillaceae bacterium]